MIHDRVPITAESNGEIGIFRVTQGKIVEKWGLIDRCGLFQQLGVSHGFGPRMLVRQVHLDASDRNSRRETEAGSNPPRRALTLPSASSL